MNSPKQNICSLNFSESFGMTYFRVVLLSKHIVIEIIWLRFCTKIICFRKKGVIRNKKSVRSILVKVSV